MVAAVTQPWQAAPVLAADAFAQVRRRAIFECCKWDPQFEDHSSLCDFPLLLKRDAWLDLACLAERLTAEVLAAEAELIDRPDLWHRLSLPRAVTQALRAGNGSRTPAIRCIRFDFHLTPDGWRLSEANSDVPGGYVEASGFAAILAGHYPQALPLPDPAGLLASAVANTLRPGAVVALVHATAYADDGQVMTYLARRLCQAGLRCVLISPDHLRWHQETARIDADWYRGPVDHLVRFYPAEWLPNLPRRSGWPHWFRDSRTPQSNPGTALLTQSKRFPLTWPALATPLPTWRALLPPTCDPRDVRWEDDEEWVLKPALGRVGDGIGLRGVTAAPEWEALRKAARRRPDEWVVQRRFRMLPLPGGPVSRYPMLGVFTIAGRAAGIYGRLAHRPLIDSRARDVAVLLDSREPATMPEGAAHDGRGSL
jgi:glutathionylspermidine synthase